MKMAVPSSAGLRDGVNREYVAIHVRVVGEHVDGDRRVFIGRRAVVIGHGRVAPTIMSDFDARSNTSSLTACGLKNCTIISTPIAKQMSNGSRMRSVDHSPAAIWR